MSLDAIISFKDLKHCGSKSLWLNLTKAFIWPVSGLQTMPAAVFMSGLLCVQCVQLDSPTCVMRFEVLLWYCGFTESCNKCVSMCCRSHELIYVCLSVELELQKVNKVMCNPIWIYFKSLKFAAPCSTSALLCLAESKCRHASDIPQSQGVQNFASSTASDKDSAEPDSLEWKSGSARLMVQSLWHSATCHLPLAILAITMYHWDWEWG